ncbi:MAG: DUF1971 domain-containing protein [bacterium]|nr:DUF1971 domain-containing protein [bacterium]
MQPPDNLVATGSSPRFDANTVPAMLLQDHSTATGVWGRLVVHAGTVEFFEVNGSGGDGDGSGSPVAAGESLWIAPEHRHRVTPSADAEFEVEFYRVTDGNENG